MVCRQLEQKTERFEKKKQKSNKQTIYLENQCYILGFFLYNYIKLNGIPSVNKRGFEVKFESEEKIQETKKDFFVLIVTHHVYHNENCIFVKYDNFNYILLNNALETGVVPSGKGLDMLKLSHFAIT